MTTNKYTVTALDGSKPQHDLSAYVWNTYATKREAKARVVSLLKAGVYQQISIKEE
jgi:hypothetical protein